MGLIVVPSDQNELPKQQEDPTEIGDHMKVVISSWLKALSEVGVPEAGNSQECYQPQKYELRSVFSKARHCWSSLRIQALQGSELRILPRLWTMSDWLADKIITMKQRKLYSQAARMAMAGLTPELSRAAKRLRLE
jgi:hypothetical protein